MFCIYQNGEVKRTFRGELKNDQGTFPAAHLRAIGADGREALDCYLFTDRSKQGFDEFHNMGPISDAAPVNGEVVRTCTPVEKNVDAVKEKMKAHITAMRHNVARNGIIFSAKNFQTDAATVDSINLIATALIDGDTFPGGTIPWDTMDTPQAPRETFEATEVQFKALRNAVSAHFVNCTKQTRVHLDAVDALSTFADLVAYDYSTGWPANPDRSEPEE